MTTVLAVGAGGALGAMFRYWMTGAVHAMAGFGFPYGTLAVNVLGSLAMGGCSVWLMQSMSPPVHWQAFLMAGLLGGFTTFSAFSLETLSLLEQGDLVRSGLNVFGSITLCVAAAWAGVVLARALT